MAKLSRYYQAQILAPVPNHAGNDFAIDWDFELSFLAGCFVEENIEARFARLREGISGRPITYAVMVSYPFGNEGVTVSFWTDGHRMPFWDRQRV